MAFAARRSSVWQDSNASAKDDCRKEWTYRVRAAASQRFTDIRKEIYGKKFPASTLLTAAALRDHGDSRRRCVGSERKAATVAFSVLMSRVVVLRIIVLHRVGERLLRFAVHAPQLEDFLDAVHIYLSFRREAFRSSHVGIALVGKLL